jgi:hypothetical protein
MSLPLYMDHNVIRQITIGCRLRGLNVLTALEDGFDARSDEEVLARATKLGRIVFTQDTDFIAITGEWLAAGRPFAGVVYGHQFRVSIGNAIGDLETICHILTAEEAANQLFRLPL